MKFQFTEKNWQTIEQGEKDCFLLTNGLGGYISLTLVGSVARGDQALFMTAKKAPNVRAHLITNVIETVTIDNKNYTLTSQRMSDSSDFEGYKYLKSFKYDNSDANTPEWTYEIEGIIIRKNIIMVHGENTVGLKYSIENANDKNIVLKVTPMLRFTSKREAFDSDSSCISLAKNPDYINSTYSHFLCSNDEYTMYIATNSKVQEELKVQTNSLFFSQDERDGRDETGKTCINHSYIFELNESPGHNSTSVIFSDKPYLFTDALYSELTNRVKSHISNLLSRSIVKSEIGKLLTVSADAYVVNRESTKGKSIIAGYPFFEDWGRDTMISLAGTTLVTGRFDECKSILRTFAKYEKKGLLPNLFPEGDENPMYNSADAPLLFINSVYEYIQFSKDLEFINEIYPVLENIICGYRYGTDFHIKMDSDGLITAGAELEQLTWMDVRVDDFLPTPRHGKPVEINAYWYSALCIMAEFTSKLDKQKYTPKFLEEDYLDLAQRVKASYNQKFWNTSNKCLKDVLSGKKDENQIRCNQIWALTMPFTILTPDKEAQVIAKVREELYTTVGLRTLSKKDDDFHPIYIGSMQERDRAYHQGTVWTFPLGAFLCANINLVKRCRDYSGKNIDDSFYNQNNQKLLIKQLHDDINNLLPWFEEGCIGQLAEIYDGDNPTISRGCFAQAWSVAEILKAVYCYEQEVGML